MTTAACPICHHPQNECMCTTKVGVIDVAPMPQWTCEICGRMQLGVTPSECTSPLCSRIKLLEAKITYLEGGLHLIRGEMLLKRESDDQS